MGVRSVWSFFWATSDYFVEIRHCLRWKSRETENSGSQYRRYFLNKHGSSTIIKYLELDDNWLAYRTAYGKKIFYLSFLLESIGHVIFLFSLMYMTTKLLLKKISQRFLFCCRVWKGNKLVSYLDLAIDAPVFWTSNVSYVLNFKWLHTFPNAGFWFCK